MSALNFRPVVSIDELRQGIPLIGDELSVVVLSEPGCGKSSLLGMLAEDNGDKWRKPGQYFPDDSRDYIYVDCPVKDMSDIGMTIPDHVTKELVYYVASLFNLSDPRPKVIMLDELNKAPKLLQVIFTRMLLERMVGDKALTDGSWVIATSNNSSDGVGDTMLAHAGNRVCIVELSKPSVNDWLSWASANGISRVTRAWVSMYPKCLQSYREGDHTKDNPYIFRPGNGVLSFVSPRSLAKNDVIVRKRDKLRPNFVRATMAGTIGLAAAKDMMVFLDMEKNLIDVKDVIRDPKGVPVPDDIAAQLMMMFQAVDTLQTQDELSSFMEFVERIRSSEVQAVFFTMMMRNPRAIKLARNNAKIGEWAKNNHELL
jgi:hypothetical protein